MGGRLGPRLATSEFCASHPPCPAPRTLPHAPAARELQGGSGQICWAGRGPLQGQLRSWVHCSSPRQPTANCSLFVYLHLQSAQFQGREEKCDIKEQKTPLWISQPEDTASRLHCCLGLAPSTAARVRRAEGRASAKGHLSQSGSGLRAGKRCVVRHTAVLSCSDLKSVCRGFDVFRWRGHGRGKG